MRNKSRWYQGQGTYGIRDNGPKGKQFLKRAAAREVRRDLCRNLRYWTRGIHSITGEKPSYARVQALFMAAIFAA